MHLTQYDIYNKNKKIAMRYNEIPEKRRDEYYNKYRNEIENYKSSFEYLKKHLNGKEYPPVKDWEKELKDRLKLRWDLCDIYYQIRGELKSMENIRHSVDNLMEDIPIEREQSWDKKRSRGFEL